MKHFSLQSRISTIESFNWFIMKEIHKFYLHKNKEKHLMLITIWVNHIQTLSLPSSRHTVIKLIMTLF